MLIHTNANVLNSLAGDYALYFFGGDVSTYSKRSELANAVAAVRISLSASSKQLVSRSVANLKAAYGPAVLGNGADIVVPQSITFPAYTDTVSLVYGDQTIAPLTTTDLSDFATYVIAQTVPADGYINIKFASDVTLTGLRHVAASYFNGNVEAMINGVWTLLGALSISTHVVTFSSIVTSELRISVPAGTTNLRGSFICYGSEVVASVRPTITHGVLVPQYALTADKLAVVPAGYSDFVDAFGMTLTVGGPLETTTDIVCNSVTLAGGEYTRPTTFAIKGSIITATQA